VGVTGRSSGSGAVRGGAITEEEPSVGAAMVLGAGSSDCRSEAGAGASLGELVAAVPGEPSRLGASVSSAEGPVEALSGRPATARDGEGDEDGTGAEGDASVAGTRASADGDQT